MSALPKVVTQAVAAALERGHYASLGTNEPRPGEEWNTLTAVDLAQPLPPIPWVCEPLGLAPGAVSLVAGYGYSRKTMALQSLGLSVALGAPVWGLWSCRKGTFVHLDYEQGRRLTQERYQRLARGMGHELTDVPSDAMRACIMPRAYLDEPNIGDRLTRLLEGASFVVVDSLRAAFPHADENSSEIRSHLDVLSRVSERTGAAIAVIHHARKPSQQSAGTATHAIRGSSALFDACQSVYVFEGEKDTPTRVHHQKDRVRGITLDEFGLNSVDTIGPAGEARWGLVVNHLDLVQMTDSVSARAEAKEASAMSKHIEQLSRVFGERGGTLKMTRAEIRSLARMYTKAFDGAWATMKSKGLLVTSGKHPDVVWSLVSGPTG
jgi:hypothetical protein